MNGDGWLVKVDLTVLLLEDWLVGGILFCLNDPRRFFSVSNELNSLILDKGTHISPRVFLGTHLESMLLTYHGFDTFGEKEAVIEYIYRVVLLNLAFFLEKNRSRVQSVIRPEYGQTGLLVSVDQGPADECFSTKFQKRF